ncbi:MarR family transcriptional regulator [Gordonia sp. VNK1]|uniref:MarR family winged helix-turn-helix transcriptional regulator n=1 Tax=Gordonia oleivorans TaxID=3156618 RepID=UPI0032B49FF1
MPEAPDHADDADRESLRDLVMTTSRALRRRWVGTLDPWHLSPHEARALRVVAHSENPRLGEIAQRLRIAPRSATEVIDRLEDRGLTERVPDERDRRARCVRTTPEGRRVLAELQQAQATDAEDFFALLTEDQRTQLGTLLRRLTTAHADDDRCRSRSAPTSS